MTNEQRRVRKIVKRIIELTLSIEGLQREIRKLAKRLELK